MNPPVVAIAIGALYAVGISVLINMKAWAAATGIFVYGLALGMGCIHQAIRETRR